MKRFWITVSVLYLASLLFTNTDFYKKYVEIPIDGFYSSISCIVIRIIGYDVRNVGCNIIHPKYSLEIAKGCDAVLPMLLLISTIFVFPNISWSEKLKGAGIGILFLALLNVIRIVSLFFIGFYAKDWFDFFHVEFWQSLFILVSMIYFFSWLNLQPK